MSVPDICDPHLTGPLSSILAWMAQPESQRRGERSEAGLTERETKAAS